MRGYDRYRRSQVRSANNVELVQMLFQEAVKRLTLAANSRPGSPERIAHLHHVREIYAELDVSLDFDAAPDFCAKTHALYVWCITTLGKSANGPGADENLKSVQRVTENLAEGWFNAAKQSPAARSA